MKSIVTSLVFLFGLILSSFSQIVVPDKVMVELEDNYFHAPTIMIAGNNSLVLAWLAKEQVSVNSWNNIVFRRYNLSGDTVTAIKKFMVPDSIRSTFGNIVMNADDEEIYIAGNTLLHTSSYLYYQAFDSTGQKIGSPLVKEKKDIFLGPVKSVLVDSNNVYLSYFLNDSGIYVIRYDTTDLSGMGTITVKHTHNHLSSIAYDALIHPPDYLSAVWSDSWNVYYLTKYNIHGDSLWTKLVLDKSAEDNIMEYPRLKTDTAGNYILTWMHYLGDGFGDLYIKFFDKDGNARSTDILVFEPEVVSHASDNYAIDVGKDGRVALAWMDYRNNHDAYDGVDTIDIYMQLFDMDGNKVGGNFKATSSEGKAEHYPCLAVSNQNIYLVWQSDARMYMNARLWPEDISGINETRRPDFNDIKVVPVISGNYVIFKLNLNSATQVDLSIYDLTGKSISHLYKGHLAEGSHSLRWDGIDNQGIRVKPGIYLYSLETPSSKNTGKIYYDLR